MNTRKKTLPPSRPWPWPLKPLASAQTTRQQLPDGRLYLTIAHDVIHGVTPAMLCWWFNHIDEPIERNGRVYPRYLLWHPHDHIAYQVVRRAPDGRVGKGARVRIVEAFGRNLDYLVDSIENVERLDKSVLTLSRRLGKTELFRLSHDFHAVREGTYYFSQMLVGADSGFGRQFINSMIRPRLFPDDMGQAWLRHNVEEVGNLEHFLPALYARSSKINS
jgi:hypothetical protein